MRENSSGSLGCELQVQLQVDDASRLCPCRIDLLRTERGVNVQLLTRPSDSHVQATSASILVQRTEVHTDVAGSIGPIADRKQNHVAFVALNRFEILYEDCFFACPDPRVQIGIL